MTNSYRVGGPVAQLNFGMVEVDWKAAQGPTVTISLSDVDGDKVFSYSFELDRLNRKAKQAQTFTWGNFDERPGRT